MSGVVVVGIADCIVTNSIETSLVTYALGSCIAVTAYDPVVRVGGLLHFMLPDSELNRNKAKLNPYIFADTGIAALLDRCVQLGAKRQRIVVKAAGGAQVMDEGGLFNIGKRNQLALRKVPWKTGVLLEAEDIGGTASRTVRLEISTGRLLLRVAGRPEREISSSTPARRGRLFGDLNSDC